VLHLLHQKPEKTSSGFDGNTFVNIFLVFQILLIVFFGLFTHYAPAGDPTVAMPEGAHQSINQKYPMFQDVNGESYRFRERNPDLFPKTELSY
jgi:hypothetical protein